MPSLNALWRALVLLAMVAVCLCACNGGAALPPEQQLDEQQDTGNDPGEEPGEQPAEEPAEEPAETPGEDPAEEPGEDPGQPAPPAGTPVGFQTVGLGFDATYSEPVVKLPASYVDPRMELPIDLALVANLDHWAFELSENQRTALSESGFFAEPATYSEFDSVYEHAGNVDVPIFITADSLQHVYHLVFNKLLREMEETRFTPLLIDMTSALEDEAGQLFDEVEGTSLEETARRAWAYFAVAEQLILEDPPQIAAPIADIVSGELALIEAHAGFEASPVLSFEEPLKEDYTQYIVRGHYTRTEQRQRYFKTIMWYGRLNARLKSAAETQVALLITWLSQKALAGERPVMELWASIYDPTAFLVGNADDPGPREYSDVMRQVYGDAITLDQLADPDLLVDFIAAARQLPPPLINSMLYELGEDPVQATQGFRFMGQRFVLDGFMIDKLTHEQVYNRLVPSGLDVLASMGSDEAYVILDEMGATSYPNYDSQLAMLKDVVGGMVVEDWTATVYASWLYSMEGLIQLKGDVFPPFMRTRPWARKELNGALGSWAELKHDTILYAKQAYIGPTSGPMYPDAVWVEPNPLAFARLRGLTDMTRAGLSSGAVLDVAIDELLELAGGKLDQCQQAAELELAGEPLPEELLFQLVGHSDWLEYVIGLTADRVGDSDAIEPAAIIADVATDPNTSRVLEVGSGLIDRLWVVIPVGSNELAVAWGGIYSYYEFMWPINDRLTDEAWREQLTNDEQPDRPAWTGMYTVE